MAGPGLKFRGTAHRRRCYALAKVDAIFGTVVARWRTREVAVKISLVTQVGQSWSLSAARGRTISRSSVKDVLGGS